MKSFFRVKSVEEVLELINRFDVLEAEMVSLDEAAGRVLAEDVSSKENLPDFDRSTHGRICGAGPGHFRGQ